MTNTKPYDRGDMPTLKVTFTLENIAADPTAVELKLKKPSGTVLSYTYGNPEIVKTSTGVYECNVDLNESGRWYYRWQGTGAVQAVVEGYLDVQTGYF